MVKPVYNLPEPEADDAEAIGHWLETLKGRYPEDERLLLSRACDWLARCQGGCRLQTGESAVRHRLATADILVRLNMDAETLGAALLKGCLEQGGVELEGLKREFGHPIVRMVEDLARIEKLTNPRSSAGLEVQATLADKDRAQHEENLRRLLLGLSEDVRVILIVLAERLHLMRAIKDLEPERRAQIARETRRLYAPLANRLGIWQIKWELEDLALRYLEHEAYRRIVGLLSERREERERYIQSVIALLRNKFAEIGIRVEITGRPKHIYSIWKKMQRKGVDIDRIFDLRAVRVLVETIADCYAALGVVHGLWPHILEEFDDYIMTPKGNLYQSLHTAVIGPEGKVLEVQIRTHEMHRHAEYGVAAHWAYKESRGTDAEFQKRLLWMRRWFEGHEEEVLNEGREPAPSGLEPSYIYVLTPQYKVIELPRGATPLDFAYAIHSEIGHRCRGAKVNDRLIPLNQPLKSGDRVEILTQKHPAPSRDWLNPQLGYLVTARARNRVRQWFRQQDFEQHLHEGRVLLERELARLHLADKPRLDELAARLNFKRSDDLLAAIGRGDLQVGQVVRQLQGDAPPPRSEPEITLPEARARLAVPPSSGSGVVIEGLADLMTHLAQCCKPVPPEPIIGFVTRGRGVSIHRRDCHNIHHLQGAERARLIEARWVEQKAGASYSVDLLVLAADRKGLVRDLTGVLTDADVPLRGIESHSERSTDTVSVRLTLEVRDRTHLDQLIAKLGQVRGVGLVRRF
ncbi:bifunctional (p)ppGpp synthetase/guanosine-3',5'-bis(diphosphate) 3'-pyrophosphohydrolase [Caldichromatium japonicum]|uniref:GTP pyrophosphokinase n=1 Tax=Caldichromatium japonicum TaxID=2699430 RepID=A0A6G7VDC7_9GAMM|nr:bifunctional (p)ppGpp synthetase/guanosine-3',5'-bis(diphosphate) 3'-pyrophosphohydrolase [Caldichromatium japonicum]QIK38021.1 bifunctional (p)ppGpp synthetase/guanosine-3',5'-bis(diphosphate) 3'-pyrophosphohydrolase [Caldichromatium japonicum]